MADPDLQKRGGGGSGQNFLLFGPQFGLKIRGWGKVPPQDPHMDPLLRDTAKTRKNRFFFAKEKNARKV